VSDEKVRLRLLFADDGEFHGEKIDVPAKSLGAYERLIDFLREDPQVLASLHIDMDRLCAAYRIDQE